jgi:hypothetical protein
LIQAREFLSGLTVSVFLEQAAPEIRGRTVVDGLEQSVADSVVQVVPGLAALVPWGHHLDIIAKTDQPPELREACQTVGRAGSDADGLSVPQPGQPKRRHDGCASDEKTVLYDV